MYVIASIGSSSGSGSIVGPSNALYVDIAGDDATGTRGNAARPFLSVQAAVNAASTGDQIRVGPGDFTVAASITIPTAVSRLSIVGSGSGASPTVGFCTTILNGASGVVVFDLGTNLGLSSFRLESIMVSSNNTVPTAGCIRASGAIYAANGFLAAGLYLDDVQIAGGGFALNLTYTRTVYISRCRIPTSGPINITSGSTTTFENCDMPGAVVTLAYDGTDALRTTTQMTINMRSSRFGATTLTGQARLVGDQDSVLASLTGNLLSVPSSGSTTFRPSVIYAGVVGTIDFQSTAAKMIPDSATAITMDFSGCMITGAFALFEVTAPSSAQIVKMTGCVGTGAALQLRAGAGIAGTSKGSAILAPTYVTTGTGTWNPGQMSFAAVALGGTTAATFVFGFTSPVTTYVVSPQSDTIGSVVTAVTLQVATGFTVNVAAAGGGSIRATVNWI